MFALKIVSATLLYIQQQSLQILPSRVVDVNGVVGRLVETVEDADTPSGLGGSGEHGKCKGFLVNDLGTTVSKDESSRRNL